MGVGGKLGWGTGAHTASPVKSMTMHPLPEDPIVPPAAIFAIGLRFSSIPCLMCAQMGNDEGTSAETT